MGGTRSFSRLPSSRWPTGLDVELLKHEWQHHGKAMTVLSWSSQGVGQLQQLASVVCEPDVAMRRGEASV